MVWSKIWHIAKLRVSCATLEKSLCLSDSQFLYQDNGGMVALSVGVGCEKPRLAPGTQSVLNKC